VNSSSSAIGAPAVIEVDPNGVIRSVTDGVADLLGWRPAELVGHPLTTIMPERFHLSHVGSFQRFVETGWSRHSERPLLVPAITADGVERDIELLFVSRMDGDERIVVGIVRLARGDDTVTNELVVQVQQTLEHLLAADRPMREVVAAAVEPVANELDWPIGVLWTFDPWVERLTALHVWERTPGEFPVYVDATRQARFARGQGFASQVWRTNDTWWSSDLSSEPDFRRAPAAATDGLRSGVFVPIQTGTGMIGVMELVDTDVRHVDAEAQRVLEIVADELGRHLAERFRRETEAIHRQRLELALSGGKMGMWTFHVPTGQVTWDETLEHAHGIAPGSFGGSFDAFVDAVHTDDRPDVLTTVQSAIDELRRFDLSYRTIGDDGAMRWIQGSGAPLIDSDGELQMLTGIAHDATDAVLDQELLQRRASVAALSADVGRALVSDETIEERLGSVVQAVVDHLGLAFARVWTVDPDDTLRLQASAGLYDHLDGEHGVVPVGRFKIGRIAATCRSHVTNDLLDDPQLSDPDWARREGMRSFAGFPLMVKERCVGVLGAFGREEMTGEVVGSLSSITDSLAVAIVQHREARRVRELLVETESERRRAESLLVERQRVASVLQESLLPPTLPTITGFEVAAAYRAGVEEVGGDFYDLFPLGAQRWGFMIGDVCGRGPEAARYTALARHTLRTALLLDPVPTRALAALDQALHAVETDGRFCTAVCGVVAAPDGDVATVSLGVAGHPPPLVVRAGGDVDQVLPTGPLLGVVPDASFGHRSLELRPGDTLVMYTDGMTEARGVEGLFGIDRLEAAAVGLVEGTARSITDGLVTAVNEYDEMRTNDDLAVLTLRRV
jgi:PAS domain S-box-containing protein